jgi:hypothetical protein
MSNRPPIPAEHRPILARLAELMVKNALASQAKEKGEDAEQQQSPPTTEDQRTEPSPL